MTINKQKMIIFSAPSGSGKTTIVNYLVEKFPELEFSISATSRAPRGEEKHEKDYFFLTPQEFAEKVRNNEFVEWEEVYPGLCYGTLKCEMDRIWAKGHIIVFDIDVKGGVNLKKIYGKQALAVFVRPPSLETLKQRLECRGTDTPEIIERRLNKAEEEMLYASLFDVELINDDLKTAKMEAEKLVRNFQATDN
jgi:guanylate kinase